eukprot:GILJ01008463.1.p1 GENE.GILJ01008463.1~~GILJ01008463.1.p1  ORF type:complete len:907 (-),score=214.06 GILJ01008463.1:178-2898(-)
MAKPGKPRYHNSAEKDDKAKEKKSNPFETFNNRRKNEVLGQRVKGANKNVAQSRTQGVKKRKETLLLEYKNQNRTNSFVDRRFGENDTSLSAEDKMLMRFQKERQARMKRGSIFNLEEEDQLTHLGQSLGDDFKDAINMSDDEDKAGDLERELVSQHHFGGGFVKREGAVDENGERKKTSKEIYEEIIAKSKMHKAEKAREKVEQEQLLDTLNDQFKDIQSLLNVRDKEKEKAEERLHRDDYDKMTRELSFDIRAKPTNRLKSEEELASDRKAELEKLERQRVKRMRGEIDSDEENEDGDKKKKKQRKSRKEEKAQLRTDDDLYENFVLEDVTAEKDSDEESESGSEEEDVEEEEDGEEQEEDGEDDEEGGEEDDEESDNAEIDELMGDHDDDSDVEAEPNHKKGPSAVSEAGKEVAVPAKTVDPVARQKKIAAAAKELPYVFKAPATHKDFLSYVEGRSAADLGTVVERIRACYHISLGAANKGILQTFLQILLTHFEFLACQHPCVMQFLDVLVPHIFQMAQELPDVMTAWAKDRLTKFHSAFLARLADGTGCAWPLPSSLLTLRLLTSIFPMSDFRHPVVTPLFLLLGQLLTQAPLYSQRDVVAALFTATLTMHSCTSGKRFAPELIAILERMVSQFFADKAGMWEGLEATTATNKKKGKKNGKGDTAPLQDSELTTSPVSFRLLSEGFKEDQLDSAVWNSPLSVADRLSVLHNLLALIQSAANLYQTEDAFPELFQHIINLLQTPKAARLPADVRRQHESVCKRVLAVRDKVLNARQPLRLQAFKPTAIRSLVPRLEERITSLTRSNDPDRERAERKHLQKKVIEEKKGAARELRKDASFLEQQRVEAMRKQDVLKQQKRKQTAAFLDEQQREWKKMKTTHSSRTPKDKSKKQGRMGGNKTA